VRKARPALPNQQLRLARQQRGWTQQEVADRIGAPLALNVTRWERGMTRPSAHYVQRLCDLFGKSAWELGLLDANPASPPATEEDALEMGPVPSSRSESPALWIVPYRRNPHFTGRDELLDLLAKQLALEPQEPMTATRRAVLSQPQAIKGLGGIGKTQIALEYAYRSRKLGRYTHTFWINAANEEAIITSFQALAEQLPSVAGRDEKDQHKLVAALLRWLQECPHPWLLIVDNADDLALVQPYLPVQGQGSILLTTRAHAVAALANAIEVDQMGLMEGTRFLLHRSQRLQVTDEEHNEACNVMIALDGFPLALDQAGAYIEETGCSFADYLQLYEQHRARLLARRGRQAMYYPNSVATTWDLSFQKVEQAHPAAAELLRLCAFLAPDHIPEELLTEAAAQWPPLLQQAVTDQFTFNELIEALLAFSLVKRLAEEHLLSVHRLVQAVQLDRMEPSEQPMWAERVVRAVNTLFPADPKEEIATWPQCLRYLEQVQACDNLIQQHDLQLPEAAELLNRAGIYLREHASYSLAEPLFQRAQAIAEKQPEPEHLQVAQSLHNLGLLYWEQGKYELAEPCYQRALRIRERTLGPHHPEVAHSLNNLGTLYWQQGKYELVEPLLQRALHIREQALGPHHPEVAKSLNNLGNLYRLQGQYALAEPLLLRTLHIQEQALGPEHPQVAYPLNNLGNLYRLQGKYELAEPVQQRALHIWEQALGPQHPEVVRSLNNLGELYILQGQYELAEPLLQRALHIWEETLSPHHPEITFPLVNLGNLSFKQGQYEQAERYYQRALSIREQVSGSQHPRVGKMLNGLANLSRERGQYEQAEALYQRALSLCQQSLGSQHPEVAEILQDLAQLRQMQHHDTEARSLYQQALAIREQALGANHPRTSETRERLRAMLNALGKMQEAAALEGAQPDQEKVGDDQGTRLQ
jgi:tetratricopeptide (TPR) repeat protein/transcriptional regulator with XRE-family HTH domain